MTQLDDRPDVRPDPTSRFPELDEIESRREPRARGRMLGAILLLVGVTLGAALVGYVLAGGRLVSRGQPVAGAPPAATAIVQPSSAVGVAPAAPATAVLPAPTALANPAPTTAPATPPPTSIPPTAQPQPTAVPTTVPPTAVPTSAPQPPTAVPQPTSAPVPVAAPAPPPPTAAPQPPTAVPQPPAAPPASAPAAVPAGAHVAIRPGMDARQAQIEGKIQEYFEAAANQDFARAQQVCCTAEWRARYPLETWKHNFDGVTDLRIVGAPRYLQVQDDLVVVENDYTFVSGGVRRNFTLRWKFTPVNGEWQGDMAEAFPTA